MTFSPTDSNQMLIASINGLVYRSARYGKPPAPRSYATPNAVEDGKP